MPSYKREFVFSGDDLFIYDFPEKTRIIYPPDTVPPWSTSGRPSSARWIVR